MSKGNVLQVI
jgi:hypothetical protein